MKRPLLVLAWLAGALGCAVVAGASCGPVDGPLPPSVAINACPAHPCAKYAGSDPLTCGGGMCVSNDNTFDFTLVVSLPESSFYGPGLTVPIPSYLATIESPQCNPPPSLANTTCLQIPQLVEPQGYFLVQKSVVDSVDAGAYIGPPSDPKHPPFQWSLPIHVQYRPLWPPTPIDPNQPAPIYVEASSIGLPLDPVQASLATATIFAAPRGTQATLWRAPLGPGIYERDVVPDDDAFPVTTKIVAATNDTDVTPIADVDHEKDPTARTFTVTRAGASLDGFTVYLRDATTLRRVSSRLTLHADTPQPITLVTSGRSPLFAAGGASSLQVVVAPPDGAPIPYFADPLVENKLGPTQPFPALPVPITVSGTVVGPVVGADGLRPSIRASLFFESSSASDSGSGIFTSDPRDPARKFMHYATTAETDANGLYQVTLPQGTYDVFVTPLAGSGAGATTVPLVVGPPLEGQPPVAAGKSLAAAPLGVFSGVATIADGRALAGATVQAQAAASIAATVVPRRWPRAQTTTTDATGAFALAVDPGTYDVVVRPAAGTGFPWVTLSSQTVVAGTILKLAPMVVPAPLSFDLVLHDPGDNPLVRATVRAFAPAAGAVSATPGAPLPVVEIGSWLTDTSGHLTMLLAPPR